MTNHPQLLTPLAIGAHCTPNRIVSTAHAENMATRGRIPRELIEYHVKRAEGGAGMIVAFGSGTVHPDADHNGNISLWDPENEPALLEMATRVREHGTVLLAQASHRGPREKPTSSNAYSSSPSSMVTPSPHGSPHILTASDIQEIIEAYARAAARLSRCRFSGIEITGLGSHLMELFWSPTINQRNDHYGGSLQNRMRFTREVIEAIDRAVPKDFLLSFRMSLDTQDPSLGLTTEDLLEIIGHIDSIGRVDTFSVSGGSGSTIESQAGSVPTEAYPVATYAHLSQKVKQTVSVPVTVAGRMLDPDVAEKSLEANQTDLVGMTRALIADPDLPQHVRQGTTDRVRPCIAINEGCRRVTLGGSLACTVNPVIADPLLGHRIDAATPRRVAVIGAGPAGMEAARTAGARGHDVTVYEREQIPGGQVRIAARDTGRPHLLRHIDWLIRELDILEIPIRLSTNVDPDYLAALDFDDVILATGSKSVVPPSLNRQMVRAITDVDLLMGLEPNVADRQVTVFDAQSYRRGAAIAADVAERLAVRTRLVTPALEQMAQLEIPNKPPLLRRLAKAEVESLTSYELRFDARGRPRLSHSWSSREIQFDERDLLVTVGWTEVDSHMAETLRAKAPSASVHIIGDAWAPRLIRNAISEGAQLGSRI